MKKAEALQTATNQSNSNRDYREKYLDMREINKDLKRHFSQLEEKLAVFMKENKALERDASYDSESNKENKRKSERQNMMLADISALISDYKKK